MHKSYILGFVFVLNIIFLYAEQEDKQKIYKMQEVKVVNFREFNFQQSYQFNPEYQSIIFSKDRMSLIRRGAGLTQDFYSEGFKRNDISFVLDGEEIKCACPNRMDAPITRVNIVEIDAFKLARTSSTGNSSLYGKIEFQRKELSEDFRVRSIISGNLLMQNEYDVQILAEGFKTGIMGRYFNGQPYKDANGLGYDSLYNYSSTPNSNYLSFGLRHAFGNFEVGITASRGGEVLFPYLRMDERETMFLSGFTKYKNNKLYFSYTSHLMNNGLRNNSNMMEMETDAKNLVIGLTGQHYDVTFRNWNADNYILNKMNSMRIDNKALPNVIELIATGNYGYDFNYFYANARLGFAYSSFSDDSVLAIFKAYDPNASKNRIFVVGALNLSRNFLLTSDFEAALSGEISTTSPASEQLFLSIRRLGQNSNWLGNPELKQHVKGNIRLDFSFTEYFKLGLNGNYIWNYINTEADTITGPKARTTYKNIDAIIANAYLAIKYEWFESQLNFTWGENRENNQPLSEIAPLRLINTLSLPKIYGIGLTLYHQWENAQTRVDTKLKEIQSESWNILGLAIDYEFDPLRFVFGVDNLLNHRFSRYLSTARDPYSAGTRVFEPGRSIFFRIMIDKGF